MSVRETYYKELGLDSTASMAEIKKAYRKKAMLLHPDINPAPDAKERFVSLNEAYEYLVNYKTGKVYSHKKQDYSKPKNNTRKDEDWEKKFKERARRRAEYHAKMKFKKFSQTRYYQTANALGQIATFIYLSWAIFIVAGVPLIGLIVAGPVGFLVSLIIPFVTAPLWAEALIHNRPDFDFGELLPSIIHVLKTKTLYLLIAILANVIVFFKIGFHTLIPFLSLISLYLLFLVLGYVVSFKIKSKFKKRLVRYCLAPGIFSLFLLINFWGSSKEQIEQHYFKKGIQPTRRGGYTNNTLIRFQNNLYSPYLGIRVFLDYENMEHSNKIEYRFEDGFFGIRVLKSYRFMRE